MMPKASPEILDRIPPQDLEAERAVLGSVLLDSSCCDDVAELLRIEDFYADAHQRLYGHLLGMRDAGEKIDALLLKERLTREGDFEAIGGTAYLAEVAQSVPYAANALHYARIVARKAKYRDMIHTATELLRSAYEEDEPDEILNRTERALGGIGQVKAEGPVPFQKVVLEAVERIDEMMRTKQGLGLPTGMMDFDEFYGGLFPGELTILAAKPSFGKTALATQIAVYNASYGRPVYLASLEMSQLEITTRLLCGASGVSSQQVRGGNLAPGDVQRLAEASSTLASATLYLDDRSQLGTADIQRTARRLARDGLRLIVVDYLQLLTPANPKDSRNEQVGGMARHLKGLARELDVPVLCLCQLNRQAAVDRWPELHHLRDSGEVEQDADVVTFLHKGRATWPPGEQNTKPDEARWIIAKNRMGETGTVQLHWSSTLVGFEPAE